MKSKFLLISSVFLFAVEVGFAQDSSRVTNHNKPNGDTTVLRAKKNKHKVKARVDSNSGTSISNTTSGTLNSTVNPSTQVVIPFGKGKKKK